MCVSKQILVLSLCFQFLFSYIHLFSSHAHLTCLPIYLTESAGKQKTIQFGVEFIDYTGYINLPVARCHKRLAQGRGDGGDTMLGLQALTVFHQESCVGDASRTNSFPVTNIGLSLTEPATNTTLKSESQSNSEYTRYCLGSYISCGLGLQTG